MRAADPVALGAWYRDCLGLDADENGLWHQEAGVTVFATFESGTEYFGSRAQQTMLNFRVRDLDAMIAQLRAKGADVAGETQDMEGVGRFGWVTDPEGNRVELWQPSELCRRCRGGLQAAGRGGEGCYQGLELGWLVADAGHGD
jgi:predicted enzyme related to lactoylglutathione lyase